MEIVANVYSLIVGVLFVASGFQKLRLAPMAVQTADSLGLPTDRFRLIGFLDAAGGGGLILGIWIPQFGIAAGICLVMLMAGSVGFRLRAKQTGPYVAMDAAFLGLAALAVLVRALA